MSMALESTYPPALWDQVALFCLSNLAVLGKRITIHSLFQIPSRILRSVYHCFYL